MSNQNIPEEVKSMYKKMYLMLGQEFSGDQLAQFNNTVATEFIGSYYWEKYCWYEMGEIIEISNLENHAYTTNTKG